MLGGGVACVMHVKRGCGKWGGGVSIFQNFDITYTVRVHSTVCVHSTPTRYGRFHPLSKPSPTGAEFIVGKLTLIKDMRTVIIDL